MSVQNVAAALLIILPLGFNLFFSSSADVSTTRTSCAVQLERS